MHRITVRSAQVVIDFLCLSLAYGLSFVLRFDGTVPWQMVKRFAFTLPYVVIFQFAILSLFGVPKFVWRYISLRDVSRILLAIGISSGGLLMVRLIAELLRPQYKYADYALVPGGVIIIDFALAISLVAGVRGLRRILAEKSALRSHTKRQHGSTRTLLVGAGQAGAMVARELDNRPDIGIKPIGFVDDDTTKTGLAVQGIKVLGLTTDLVEISKKIRAQQALITIGHAPGDQVRRIVQLCKKADLPVRIIPGLNEILDGTFSLTRIRDVSIEDLLGREPVHLDQELIENFVRGKRVMVTGAGGSIGMELCRQIMRYKPSMLSLVERAEYHLFRIHHELVADTQGVELLPRLCDICDTKRLETVFAADRPHVVFHAAAHKHVPMVEYNPGEAIKNNIFGTIKVASAADRFGSKTFVLISTDKAVNPTSIMGATKRVAEMYVQALSANSQTKYVAVRFGNVLGSAGSVIPIFREQISKGGPVTVTHPDMKRYFMTIPEASQLVLQSAAMGRGGEIFVLDMGTPVNIADLARDLIRLSGYAPDEDIKIEFTGIRPGEKLFEQLGFDSEKMDKTRHPKIFIGKLRPHSKAQLEPMLETLRNLTSSMDAMQVHRQLEKIVPEMIRSYEPSAIRAES